LVIEHATSSVAAASALSADRAGNWQLFMFELPYWLAGATVAGKSAVIPAGFAARPPRVTNERNKA
jgi:hypothetical protein